MKNATQVLTDPEAFCITAINDLYHVGGVPVDISLNKIGAPSNWSIMLPDDLVNKCLREDYGIDLNDLRELGDDEAKAILFDALYLIDLTPYLQGITL